jgi:hypothetical protein
LSLTVLNLTIEKARKTMAKMYGFMNQTYEKEARLMIKMPRIFHLLKA